MDLINALLFRFKETEKEKQPIYKTFFKGIKTGLEYLYLKIFKFNENFIFRGGKFNYFYYPYNATWRNERMVEIPIIWKIVKKYKGKNILEFGNVLSHYFSFEHDVLDKYEKDKGVINKDVIDFEPGKKYDLIVSISTLEHVGFDETKKDSKKILKAIEKLKECLNEKGKMIITVPFGWNPNLDRFLKEKKIKFTEEYYLKKISKNKWIETNYEDIKNKEYDKPHSRVDVVVVGVIERKEIMEL